jgi:hypothetical protein
MVIHFWMVKTADWKQLVVLRQDVLRFFLLFVSVITTDKTTC